MTDTATGTSISDALIGKVIGQKVRDRRKALGLTMAQLSTVADISQPHLSQLENGKASPSINTLYRLANALEISPQLLLPGAPTTDVVVYRASAEEIRPVTNQLETANARVLSTQQGRLQVQEILVEPGQQLGDWFEHDGEEFLFVIEGSVMVELKDHEPVMLDKRDGMWFLSSIPHRWTPTSENRLRLLAANVVSEAAMGQHSH